MIVISYINEKRLSSTADILHIERKRNSAKITSPLTLWIIILRKVKSLDTADIHKK